MTERKILDAILERFDHIAEAQVWAAAYASALGVGETKAAGESARNIADYAVTLFRKSKNKNYE